MVLPAPLRIVEREASIFRKLWHGSVFSYFASPVLFLVAMGVGLGGMIDDRPGDVGGLDYLDFVTPGLMMAGAMQIAAGDSLWPVMGGTKWLRTFHGMVATPLASKDVFAGVVGWTTVRSAMSATAFLVVAALLGGVSSPLGVLTVPTAMLCSGAFAAPLAAFSATQDADYAFAPIMQLGVLPLFLFSGTFFPVETLPDWLEPARFVSPLWHAVELARQWTTGDTDWVMAPVHVAVLVGCILLGARWGQRSFERKLTP